MTEPETETTNQAVLHWAPSVGFELDLDYVEGELSIRMVRVPVPAEGTRALGEPVGLYPLDTLFKCQVDIAGAPGQLDDVAVRLADGDLRITATVEDAETGQSRSLDAAVPVELERDAPESGGPVPPRPDEDDLDFDDEETLERLFEDAPEGPPPGAEKVKSPEVSSEMSSAGIEALLKALASPDLEEPGEPEAPAAPEPEPAPPEPPPEEPADDDAGLANLLAAIVGGPEAGPEADEHPDSQLMSAREEARSFLELLVGRDELELTRDGGIDALAPGAADILQKPATPADRASELANWLLEQDEVEELYILDAQLAELLERW